jgi:hypothetical protein
MLDWHTQHKRQCLGGTEVSATIRVLQLDNRLTG